MFVPLFVVFGVPAADGSTMIVINAPEPMPDGLEVPNVLVATTTATTVEP